MRLVISNVYQIIKHTIILCHPLNSVEELKYSTRTNAKCKKRINRAKGKKLNCELGNKWKSVALKY